MEKQSLPIGFFDSGLGGLSVMLHAMQEMPNEKFLYYGDTLHAPYGIKTEEEIKHLSLDCGEFLYQKGVKVIVMACNTATSAAVQKMREKYQIPVVSIEPAVKVAIEKETEGKILVMATPATISQERYHKLLNRLQVADRVINLPCKGLVELIEPGNFPNQEIEAYLSEKFLPLQGQDIRGIVIGCTHYSFVSNQIQTAANAVFAGPCHLYDGMYGMVRQLKHILQQEGLAAPPQQKQEVRLYSSGTGQAIQIMEKVLQQCGNFSSSFASKA